MAGTASQAGDADSSRASGTTSCRGPWMSTVVLYCCCHSDSASVLCILLPYILLLPFKIISLHHWNYRHLDFQLNLSMRSSVWLYSNVPHAKDPLLVTVDPFSSNYFLFKIIFRHVYYACWYEAKRGSNLPLEEFQTNFDFDYDWLIITRVFVVYSNIKRDFNEEVYIILNWI